MIKISITDIPKQITGEIKAIVGQMPVRLYITLQKTGYGYKQFFVCPICGERRMHLYIEGKEIGCRNCLTHSPYWGIQNTTRGGHIYIRYKMEQIARRYGIKIEYPFTYYQLLLKKPKYLHNKTWRKVAAQLQILENMRNQAIFFNRFYEPQLIQYVMENCLFIYPLQEINKYLLDWNVIVREHKKDR